MTVLDAWTRELATKQGRITPALGAVAGTKAFCLGFDTPGHAAVLAPGDFAQIEQEATFTPGTRIFRMSARVRPPTLIPTGYKWVLSLLVDDVEMTSIRLDAGGPTRTRTLDANVSKLAAGNHFVTIRLRLLTDDNTQYIVLASIECGP